MTSAKLMCILGTTNLHTSNSAEDKNMITSFPLAKLGGLLLRHVSRPIADAVKQKAKDNYFFRTHICMPPAQSKYIHSWEGIGQNQMYRTGKTTFVFRDELNIECESRRECYI